ncbi:adenosylcobinamide-GDP ribazoletransferase [bacterium]|nr:MAG: adenosylcobinamide-GDP ribazoletransferase [bacterium]
MPGRFKTAFSFLTVIPLFKPEMVKSEELGRSISAFPLVGAALGLLMAVLHLFITSRLPSMLEGALLTAFLFWVTGGLHMDGVADTADGLMSGKNPERALEIMKDSRTGAHGAAAVTLVILAKAAAIGYLPAEMKLSALLAVPAIARGTMAYMAYQATYARPGGGLGTPFTEFVDDATLYKALGLAALISLAAGLSGLVAFVVTWGWVALLKNRFHSKLGGITGDLLGFTVETGEIAALVALHIISYGG